MRRRDFIKGIGGGAVAPSAGWMMVTRGGALPTPIVIVLVEVRLSLSVTVAVMTWRPAMRRGAVTVAPTPSEPATLDDQRIGCILCRRSNSDRQPQHRSQQQQRVRYIIAITHERELMPLQFAPVLLECEHIRQRLTRMLLV